ncbi:expressed unknown protein [Seminavis robusta]|uniref:Ribosomal RNA large subunit methyltransferase K/L-like methyltransferase domain-containing protein n=1 Tax=Seminavis robusta TaxID=568900 RepID=A0A9N8EAL1_9STRA|nr:expressed unknown protein [Seminavis robusta]|eukprot:Sro732_g194470.1 n/a (588) ;mRNA; f:41581-43344
MKDARRLWRQRIGLLLALQWSSQLSTLSSTTATAFQVSSQLWKKTLQVSSPCLDVSLKGSNDNFDAPADSSNTPKGCVLFRATIPRTMPERRRSKRKRNIEEDNVVPCSSNYESIMTSYFQQTQSTNTNATIIHTATPSDYMPSTVDFAMPANCSLLPEICRSLPATRLSVVVAQWNANPSSDAMDEMTTRSRNLPDYLSRAKAVWSNLGNHEEDKTVSSFCISPGNSKQGNGKQRQSRAKTSSEPSGIMGRTCHQISEIMTQCMGWVPHTKASSTLDPTFSFLLRAENSRNQDSSSVPKQYALELMVLERRWPLPKLNNNNNNPNTKRIESFVVARSANLQPNEVVWDPFCQRGTFLVEAAKYWPTATYHGTDKNMGHLQHAQMNAKSTATHLHLYHHVNASFPNGPIMVDKILTRLPSRRHQSYYQRLLTEWSNNVLRPSGTVVLLVNVPDDLDALKMAVHNLSGRYEISFLRSPSFPVGNTNSSRRRATLAILRHRLPPRQSKKEQSVSSSLETRPPQQSTTRVGLLEWEQERLQAAGLFASADTKAMQQVWAQIRSETLPWMVPYTSRKLEQTRIQLSNGKLV